MKVLLRSGVDANEQGDFRMTSLHVAALKGHEEVAKILIDAGGDVNKRDQYGSTPLFHAVVYGHLAVVKVLIAADANVNLQNLSGLMPLYVATKEGHQSIVQLIKDHMARAEMRAFLAAQHQRLGVQSPVHNLPQDAYKEIFALLRNVDR